MKTLLPLVTQKVKVILPRTVLLFLSLS